LNINFSGDIGRTVYDNENIVLNQTSDNILVSDFNTFLDQTDYNYTIDASANYNKKFAKAGRFTGGNVSYSKSNNELNMDLNYLNTLVQNGVPIEVATNQQQSSIETTDNIAGTWTWSEPIAVNQLLQFDLGASRASQGRDKEVFDIVAPDNLNLNSFLSGRGDYYKMHYNGEIRHKFFATKVKTTVGAKYKHLDLIGAEIFTAPKPFDYILPHSLIEWDPNKKTNVRLRYSTSITAPSLNQLQPILDNTNPSQVILGNTDLSPEYRHSVNLRLHNFNQFNFSFFMVSLTGSYTQNNIVYAQTVNEYYITELTPENIGDEKSINSFIMYGSSLHPIKTKFRVSASGSVSNGLINLNGMQDNYTTYSISPKIGLENIGKKIIDIRTGFGYNYSLNTYASNEAFNANYSNYNYYADVTFKIKDRWLFNPQIDHFFYPDFETNNQLVLIDFSVAVNLLESRELQLFVSGKDMLNQNTGLNQYYLQNFYEQEVTQTLGRYFMAGIKYSFKKLGANEEKERKKKKKDSK
jgi:hypothetical protein